MVERIASEARIAENCVLRFLQLEKDLYKDHKDRNGFLIVVSIKTQGSQWSQVTIFSDPCITKNMWKLGLYLNELSDFLFIANLLPFLLAFDACS